MAERARLYSLELSHPGMCARLALERKGIDYRLTNLMPGMHPAAVRALGFPHNTVPALKIDGVRVQGSRPICAYLDRAHPDPPLYGTDPDERVAIEAAEAWGERVVQPLPRGLFRYGARTDPAVMRWMAVDMGMPAPGLMARINKPVAVLMARAEGADEERVRADLQSLPDTLDRIDELIAAGTIGGDEPNAADLQILPTVRVLEQFTDLRPLLEGRPLLAAAERTAPQMPGPIPAWIPPDWLPPAATAQAAA